MILFYNPNATKPRNRRLPLSILAIAAVVEGKEDYALVDGNLDPNPTESLIDIIKNQPVELLAVTVMPGPQTVGAVASCREIRARFPHCQSCGAAILPPTIRLQHSMRSMWTMRCADRESRRSWTCSTRFAAIGS